ncbi:MAG: MFS transporter [Candidatus Rokuibacteriota bacterium]|nr:MAG: MFS transporter [Candidatus Rokubacteria bacterium]
MAGLSITETVSWGILYYGFPVMLRPMEADLGFSRAQLTGALSIGLLTSALAALPIGRWIDRHGARGIMTLGSILGTALVLAWARVESLGALYAVWALMGLAMAATLYEPAFAAIVGWFPMESRDRALLVVTLVAALASTIFMPFEAWLVGRLGWRGALAALAMILAVPTIPIHAFVLRRPSRHGGRSADEARVGAPMPGLTLGAAARTGVFWVLVLAFLASNFTTNSVTVHLIPYLSDRGYSPTLAAAMIGWMGAMQLPARLVFGPIVARFGHRALTVAIFLFQAMALAQLALVRRLPTLAPMVVMLGAANGMATLARATTIAEIFGPRHYGSISGAVALGANGARAVAPFAASLLQVALGGYEGVFWLLAGALVLAGLGLLAAPTRVRHGSGAAHEETTYGSQRLR